MGGNYASIIPHARKIINPYLKNCVKCLKNDKNIQTFSPPVGNPRFFSLLESSSPIFLGISTDMIGPVKFLLRRGARGAQAAPKGYIIIIVNVLTRFITYHRAPKFVLSDAK